MFIFLFLRSSIEDKRGDEFCHLTCEAFRIQQKVGNGVFRIESKSKRDRIHYTTVALQSHHVLLGHEGLKNLSKKSQMNINKFSKSNRKRRKSYNFCAKFAGKIPIVLKHIKASFQAI